MCESEIFRAPSDTFIHISVSLAAKMATHLSTVSAMFMKSTLDDSVMITKRTSIKTPVVRTKTNNSSTNTHLYKWDISWRNILAFIYLHTGMIYGFYLILTTAKLATTLFALLFMVTAAMGVTAGAHRLWAHKTYKAKWPLRIILAILQTMSFQNHIYEWVRDHRVHHKFTDTDADPHNASRGFFFSHIGWLMVKKHKDVKEKGKTVDMSDLEEDFVVVWQRRTFLVFMPLLCFVLPTCVPVYFWGENGWVSWYVAAITRYTLSLNVAWCVNSVSHIWGMKPYDKSIGPVEAPSVALLTFGEGWHNYHHVFPWDYKAAELGNYGMNLTTAFIDFFAKIGWAYDMKTVSLDMVRKRARRTGDGTWKEREDVHGQTGDDNDHHHHGNGVWGWGDKDMPEEDIKEVTVLNKSE